jgi:hypothetical protein
MEPSTNGKLQPALMVRRKEASRLAHIASLEATGDPTLVAFYHSNATADGSAFLEAKPKSYSLKMSNASMMLAVKRRLRIAVCLDNMRCNCKGWPAICADGLHILHKCAKGEERIKTHDGIVDTMVSFGRYAGLRCEAEVNGFLRNVDPDHRQRPDGLI